MMVTYEDGEEEDYIRGAMHTMIMMAKEEER